MPLLDQIDPPLSSVRIQHYAMGHCAARLLLDALRDAGQRVDAGAAPELMVRGSTAGHAPTELPTKPPTHPPAPRRRRRHMRSWQARARAARYIRRVRQRRHRAGPVAFPNSLHEHLRMTPGSRASTASPPELLSPWALAVLGLLVGSFLNVRRATVCH